MVRIAGSSQYVNAATLANQRGLAAQSPTLLSEGSTQSLLDVGRNLSSGSGIGISSAARALNQTLLNRSSDVNAMFSLGVGSGATIEGAQQQILALRAGLSESQLARSLREDDGGVSESETGQEVDTEA